MSAAIEDRLAITDLLHRCAGALDASDWAGLEALFTSDAEADFGAFGGVRQGSREIARFCARALGRFDVVQHIIGNVLVRADGTSACSSCSVLAVHVSQSLPAPFTVGGVYEDSLRRAEDARWRIARRVLVIRWCNGAPEGLRAS